MKNLRWVSAVLLLVLLVAACSPAATPETKQPTAAQQPAPQNTPSGDPALTSEYSLAIAKDMVTEVDTAKYKKDGPYVIGISGQDPSNGWGLTFTVSAKAFGEELLANGTLAKPLLYAATNDANKQISDIEDLIQQKPDALVVEPLGRASSVAAVKRAVDAGIPVVLCGNGIEGEDFTSRVDINIYEIAYRTMDGLANLLGKKGNIVLFHGIAGIDYTETAQQGAMAALKNYPDIKVVAEDYAQFNVATAKQKMEAMLAANPDVNGVWAGGGAMALGSALAFIDANKPAPAFGVMDIPNGFLRLAKEHNYKFVAYPQPGGMSRYCIQAAVDILQGKSVKKFVDLNTVMEGAGGYDHTSFEKWYVPELNDDFNTPMTVDKKYYLENGFARK